MNTTTHTPKQICDAVMISGLENGSWDLDFNPEAKDDNGELRRGYFFAGSLAWYVEDLADCIGGEEDWAIECLNSVAGHGAINEQQLSAAIAYYKELAS